MVGALLAVMGFVLVLGAIVLKISIDADRERSRHA